MSLPVIVSVTFANSIGRAGAGAWLSGDLLALSRLPGARSRTSKRPN